MRTLDINVIVRLLVGDFPHQTPIAERVFLNAVGSGGIFFRDVVLADQLILARAARAGAPPAAQGGGEPPGEPAHQGPGDGDGARRGDSARTPGPWRRQPAAGQWSTAAAPSR